MNIIRFFVLFILFILTACSNQSAPPQVSEIEQILDSVRARLDASEGEIHAMSLDEVKNSIDSVLEKEPGNFKALTEYAKYYLKTGYRSYTYNFKPVYYKENLDKANALVNKAIASSPDYIPAIVVYGRVQEGYGEYDNAIKAFEQAQQLGKNDGWFYVRWGIILFGAKQFEEGIVKFHKALELGTDDNTIIASAYEYIARGYEISGDLELANESYKKSIEKLPNNAWIKGSYSKFLSSKLDRIDKAIKYAEEALTLKNYGLGRSIYAEALYAKWAKLKKEDPMSIDADEYYNRAYTLKPNLEYVAVYVGGNEITRYVADALFDFDKISINQVYEETGLTLLNEVIYNNYDGFIPNEKYARYLLERGADPNLPNISGWAPLHLAAERGDLNIVNLLLEYDADANIELVNKSKRYKASDIARQRGHEEVAKYIESLQ